MLFEGCIVLAAIDRLSCLEVQLHCKLRLLRLDLFNNLCNHFVDLLLVTLDNLHCVLIAATCHRCTRTAVKVVRELQQLEEQSWQSVCHSGVATLDQNRLELDKHRIPDIMTLRADQIHHLAHAVLALSKLISVFVARFFLIVLQKRHDEFNQLIEQTLIVERCQSFQHRFDNFERDYSLVSEVHILHENGVLIHAQDSQGVFLQRN